MGPLIEGAAPAAAALLDGIACPPVAVVALGYGAEALAAVPRGFGALIPREEGYRILGCLWDTHLFAGRSPEGRLLVRCMLGGAVDPEAGSLDPRDLVRAAREDLARLFDLHEAPVFEEVVRWPRAIPQYELGHLQRVQDLERELQRHRGLFAAGNALHGVSFGKAAAAGAAAAERALEQLARGTR